MTDSFGKVCAAYFKANDEYRRKNGKDLKVFDFIRGEY